ncbi:hypothetical protein [Arhodomonas sp. AD133]|uniref:hypothetical protein n=1 Tax=Arhodomonas sp. AD133 TaxID=3415009 RepID=UPI003EBC125B
MTLWRDEALAAVNEVLTQCESNARHHRYSAEVLAAPALAGSLQRLAAERERMAEQLAYQLRAHGDLPDASDSELDSLHELGDRLMARLAARGTAVLLRERAEDERRLAAAAQLALGHAVPGDVRPQLEHIRASAQQAATQVATLVDRDA